MLQEFKAFINRGNVLDLAVGVIIGGAFSKIVDSLTGDLIMPVVGSIFGGFDFSNYFVRLGKIPADFKGSPESYLDLKAAGVAVFGYGEFITQSLNFLIMAFIIFLLVRTANRVFNRDENAAVPENILLLREIRDGVTRK